jgi:hypothetical protein
VKSLAIAPGSQFHAFYGADSLKRAGHNVACTSVRKNLKHLAALVQAEGLLLNYLFSITAEPTWLRGNICLSGETFMTDEKVESSGFKVVDRRSFTNEGTRVAGQPEKAEEKPEPETRIPEEPAPAPPAEPEPEIEDGEGSERFAMLVSYLSTTAMFQLGLLPGPGGEYIPSDLPNASRTIDLLEVLQEKTRGNLTGQESKLLDEVLYELRMTYLEVQKRASKQR